MLNPFIWLILLSITMLVGSFIFGCIPLSAKLSEHKLRQLTAIGVGLLIGTSLVVIIPEGVETLYSSAIETTSTQHHHHDSALPPLGMKDTTNTIIDATTIPSVTSPPWHTTTSAPPPATHMTIENPQPDDHDEHTTTPKHTSVGLALILGFGVMFIIDQYSSLHAHGNDRHDHELDSMIVRYPNNNEEQEDTNTPPSLIEKGHHSMTPTIGLMVHAAADGIALGASASHPQLSMVVFFAIMLHKGPSAFALTTVLLAEGFSRTEVRKHLLLFSMAAPIGALTTYVLLSMTFTGDMDLEYWTGVLLLFSGGTFLYVAMHALQELNSPHSDKLDRANILCILLGMILPVILNLGHSH
ncbi:Zinc/iron permease [Chlamydoabsidia padenii]|nr:Zinc/iron permease [Chlamydoabsidia padenii]